MGLCPFSGLFLLNLKLNIISFCHCSTSFDIKGEKYPDRQRNDACTKQKHGRFQLVAPEPLGKLEERGSQRV